MQPLKGLTVVTLEHAIAAPFATRQLADLGARVIKIERPGVGDFARGYDSRVRGLASHFVWTNRSKESLTLDVKHPAAAAPGHRSRTTDVPAACSAVVPISMAVAAVMFVPLMVTVPPPAIGPRAGVAEREPGAVGRVPAVVTESVAGLPSVDDTRVGELFCTVVDVTVVPVTIATTVSTGRAVPLAKDEALVVQVMVWPTGAAQTQPVP